MDLPDDNTSESRRPTPRDRLWPSRNPRWWTPDRYARRPVERSTEYEQLFRFRTADEGARVLGLAREVADTAMQRAASADSRAATIAGSVSIAASFVLSGGSLALDSAKLTNFGIRITFSVVLFMTVVAFTMSAVYALRGLVTFRVWARLDPKKLMYQRDVDPTAELTKQVAGVLRDFSFNWEVSDAKNRNVDLAFEWLVAALAGVCVLAALFVLGILIT